MAYLLGIPLPETIQNPANYPDFGTAQAQFDPARGGTKSLWLETLISLGKDLAVTLPLAALGALVMTIAGGPASFFVIAVVFSVLSSLMRAARFYCARKGEGSLYNFLTRYGSTFLYGAVATTMLVPLIQGGLHALAVPTCFAGPLPRITAHLMGGYSLSHLGTMPNALGAFLGLSGSQLFVSALGTLTTVISASLLLSISKQAAKVDPDLANFLWISAIAMIVSEFFNTLATTFTTGNPLCLLSLLLIALAYPLVLLFDKLFNCCTPRAAAGGAGPAPDPFAGPGMRLGADAPAAALPEVEGARPDGRVHPDAARAAQAAAAEAARARQSAAHAAVAPGSPA